MQLSLHEILTRQYAHEMDGLLCAFWGACVRWRRQTRHKPKLRHWRKVLGLVNEVRDVAWGWYWLGFRVTDFGMSEELDYLVSVCCRYWRKGADRRMLYYLLREAIEALS